MSVRQSQTQPCRSRRWNLIIPLFPANWDIFHCPRWKRLPLQDWKCGKGEMWETREALLCLPHWHRREEAFEMAAVTSHIFASQKRAKMKQNSFPHGVLARLCVHSYALRLDDILMYPLCAWWCLALCGQSFREWEKAINFFFFPSILRVLLLWAATPSFMGIFVITECLWEWWIIWAVPPEASGFVREAGDCQWSSSPVWPYHSHYWTCSLSCSMRVGNKLLHGSSKQCRDQWEIILPDRCLCLVDPASTAKVKSWRLSSWAEMAAQGKGKITPLW